jgi:PAS domain S-box-containing protein
VYRYYNSGDDEMDNFLRDLTRVKDILDLVHKITRTIVDKQDESGLNETLDHLVNFIGAEFGVLGYLSGNKEYLTAAMSGNVWNVCGMTDKQKLIFKKHEWKGIWADIIQDGKEVVLNNQNFVVPGDHVQIKNVMGCPIKRKGDVIGYFLMASNIKEFTEDDLSTLTWFSTWLAPIISNRIKEIEGQERIRKMQISILEMMNYANMYVLVLDENMKIKFINSGLVEELGYDDHDNLIGQCWLDYIDERDRDLLKVIHHTIVTNDETPEKYREIVGTFKSKTGKVSEVRWFNARINHIYNWSLSFAVPVKDQMPVSAEDIREYWHKSVLKDKTVIQAMRDYLTKSSVPYDNTCESKLE